jgi:hypothetical protein
MAQGVLMVKCEEKEGRGERGERRGERGEGSGERGEVERWRGERERGESNKFTLRTCGATTRPTSWSRPPMGLAWMHPQFG